jgi:hypothetical protein
MSKRTPQAEFDFREKFGEIGEETKKLRPSLGDAEFIRKTLEEMRAGFNAQLLARVETGDPYADWVDYKDGDVLFETKKPIDDRDWHMTKSGLIMLKALVRSASGFEFYYTVRGSSKTVTIPFEWPDYAPHPEGVIHKDNGSLILNKDERVLYSWPAGIPGGISDFCYHPWGFLVSHGSEVWLNGNILLTDRLDEGEEYKVNEGGIIVRRNPGNYEFHQNNRHFLAADEGDRNDLWLATGVGVITSRNVKEGVDYFLNEEHLTHRQKHEPMKPHSQGVVFVENGERSTRLVLNGKKTLYEGKLTGFKSYKNGVVVHRKKSSTRNTHEFIFSKGTSG